ncbi:hypothetical protein Tco_0605879 [Tanacetum coccineum]
MMNATTLSQPFEFFLLKETCPHLSRRLNMQSSDSLTLSKLELKRWQFKLQPLIQTLYQSALLSLEPRDHQINTRLGHISIILSISHTIETRYILEVHTHYPCDIARNIRVIRRYSPMKMEILLEPTANKLSYERSHKGVKASANSDIIFFFTSAQDGNKLLDDERLSLADDLKKAHDQNQNKSK